MELRTVDPTALNLNPDNPRRTKASAEADAALAANIKAIGLIQPPFVRETDGVLVVKAGERRVKAAIIAGLASIPVIVAQGDDETADPLRSLAENVQRAQMGPVDQWRAIEAMCGVGWSEEAIGTAFSMAVRSIRKLRLLATIHPAMLDRMAYDLPNENSLRAIAAAPLEDQAAVWKTLKPKKGQDVPWWEIARALHKERLLATAARFDEETARNFGVRWEDDLFGPADQDNRSTTDVEAFLAAQQHWLESSLPKNGLILERDQWGTLKLPKQMERCFGQARKGDKLGFHLDPRTGEVSEVRLREIVRATSDASGGAPSPEHDGAEETPRVRPPISRKGIEQIGDLRTDALHQGLRGAPIPDDKLIGLLVLALGAQNVTVHSAAGTGAGGYHQGGQRGLLARRLIEGGHLTADLALLRTTARDMLVQVLSCREGMSQSGVVARVAGTAINADAFLVNMAEDDFLKCLSKGGIAQASRELNIQPRNTAKEMRSALIEQVGQDTYVLPAARFALSEDELAELQARADDDRAEPDGDGDENVSDDDTVEDPDDEGDALPAAAILNDPVGVATEHVTA